MKIAKERKSAVLASNAVHHRIDSLTSFVALLTIGGAHVISDAAWLDPVGGLLISFMVIRAGYANTMSSLLELGDVTVDDEVKTSVRRAAAKAIKGDTKTGLVGISGGDAIEIKEVQGVKSGQNYLMDIELGVPSKWTVDQIAAVEAAVRERAGAKVRGVRRVKVRFTPLDKSSDFIDEYIGADVSPRSSPEPEDEHDYDPGHDHKGVNGVNKNK